jgi:hypothetical protein
MSTDSRGVLDIHKFQTSLTCEASGSQFAFDSYFVFGLLRPPSSNKLRTGRIDTVDYDVFGLHRYCVCATQILFSEPSLFDEIWSREYETCVVISTTISNRLSWLMFRPSLISDYSN